MNFSPFLKCVGFACESLVRCELIHCRHHPQAEEKEDEEREKRVSAAQEKKQARAVEAAVEASKVCLFPL